MAFIGRFVNIELLTKKWKINDNYVILLCAKTKKVMIYAWRKTRHYLEIPLGIV